MLRDQFVLGLKNDIIRKILLSELKLTFDKAVQTATLIGQANMEAKAVKTTGNLSVHHIKFKGYGDTSNVKPFQRCKNKVWKRYERCNKMHFNGK